MLRKLLEIALIIAVFGIVSIFMRGSASVYDVLAGTAFLAVLVLLLPVAVSFVLIILLRKKFLKLRENKILEDGIFLAILTGSTCIFFFFELVSGLLNA